MIALIVEYLEIRLKLNYLICQRITDHNFNKYVKEIDKRNTGVMMAECNEIISVIAKTMMMMNMKKCRL